MTASLVRRVERLEAATVTADGVAIVVGQPSEEQVERLHGAGAETVIWLPDNGRGGEPWRRSVFE